MERIVSSEERIRRAEQIYNRRKMQNGVRVSTRNVNTKTKLEYNLFKKMILQILICLVIYFIFYLVKNSNYVFSENFINQTREFLSYDINFEEILKQIGDYYNNNLKSFFEIENDVNEMQSNVTNEINSDKEITNNETQNIELEGGIGGGEEGTNLLVNEMAQTSTDEQGETKPLSQMEIDANEIKANYNLILPLKGIITSKFGPREATEIISANHAGIDIGVNEGTVYVAAMEGKVTYVSSEGGYGNHVYIEKNDVTTLYAHCKTIYVKEGDEITQGQAIGEVGQTGNATGPHLHFEVRKDNRVVNPEYIINF